MHGELFHEKHKYSQREVIRCILQKKNPGKIY